MRNSFFKFWSLQKFTIKRGFASGIVLEKNDSVGDEVRKIRMKDMQEYYHEYYVKNKSKLKKNYDIKYPINKEKINERRREIYLKNKSKINEKARENYEKNRKERIKRKKEKNKNYDPKPKSLSWKDRESTRRNFEIAAKILHISSLSDWYRISRSQLEKSRVVGCLGKFSSLGEALMFAYPEFEWDISKFSIRKKRSAQRWLYVKIKQLLPNADVVEDYYHPDLQWDHSKTKNMQFDIWIPQYNLAIEYQGEHHYFDIPSAFGPSSTCNLFFERDKKKKEMCLQKGITLVCIPFWWDGQIESLSSTLHLTLPEIFQKKNSPPIPSSPPQITNKKVINNHEKKRKKEKSSLNIINE